jgi:hypothetical protein
LGTLLIQHSTNERVFSLVATPFCFHFGQVFVSPEAVMQTTPITVADLRSSVVAVPPLARNADLTLNDAANTALIRHMEAGGVRTLLYGGNANLYNTATFWTRPPS